MQNNSYLESGRFLERTDCRSNDVESVKTRASKLLLDLVLLLTGWESGASFSNQLQSVISQNQSKREFHSKIANRSALDKV